MHKILKISFMVVLLLLGTAEYMNGQHEIISGDSLVLVEKTVKKFSKNVNFTVLPGPVYNSTQRLGFVILPVLVYNLDTTDKLSPPSSTGLQVYFNFYGSWLLSAKQNLYWNQNKWRASADIGFGSFRQKFFGIGRDTTIISNADSNYVWSRLYGFYANLNCYRKIVSKLFGGLQYNFSNSTMEGTDSVSTAWLQEYGLLMEDMQESTLIPSFIWDNRDNVFWSVRGFYAGINLQFANSLIFSSFDYSIVTGFVNGYHLLSTSKHRLSLAWHFYMQAGWGELPYPRMATYGKGDRATGYTSGKYVNNSELSAQTELRYDLWKFIAVGGYVGTGKVFPAFDVFGQSVWLHFGGARVYVNVMPSRNLRVRLDCAVARDDFGFYVGVGQAF